MKNSGVTVGLLRRLLFLWAVVGAISVLFSLVGCERRVEGSTVALLSGALDAEITFERDGTPYRATVHLGREGEDGTRDAEMILLSPASVAGMTVSVRDGRGTVTLGESTEELTERAAVGLLLPVRLLSGGNAVKREAAKGATELRVTLADGRVLVLSEEGALLAVESGDTTVRIAWIEPRG